MGILNNYPEFAEEKDAHLQYDFSAAELKELKSAYVLEDIAKTGIFFAEQYR